MSEIPLLRTVHVLSDSHFHGNLWMWLVADDLKVFKLEIINVLYFPLEDELGEWFGFPFYLWRCGRRGGSVGVMGGSVGVMGGVWV